MWLRRSRGPEVKQEQDTEAAWEARCLELEARLRPSMKNSPESLKYYLEGDFATYRIDDTLPRIERLQKLYNAIQSALALSEEIQRNKEAGQAQEPAERPSPGIRFGCCGSAQ